jgi:trafficking protein particle complex subunit 10
MLTLEAQVIDSDVEFAKKPESGGIIYFNEIAADSTVILRFPYSVEHDIADVSAKVDVAYTLESGQKYTFAKSIIIPISLALGVNVQDVFKHNALYSRFNVSTASHSPLRLYKSELIPSDLFESEFGVPPADTTMVFSKQPATLLYRIKRKTNVRSSKRAARTMYLKLYYNILQTEIEEALVESIFDALDDPSLASFSKLITSLVVREAKALQPIDLERAALLGAVPTAFLADVPWDKYFAGIGRVPGTQVDATEKISTAIREWQASNPQIQISAAQPDNPCTLLIPVEIPSLPILHTADIELQTPVTELMDQKPGAVPTVAVNQMLPATLHLRWTQIWDTEMQHKKDMEYSYEVAAAGDTWLLGGRRKGHFVIPGSKREPLSSTSDTEAEIPLIMIPLREGWLPYPGIEIREVKDGVENQAQTCEVDFRNLGESIRAVGERKGVTVSLDASGPGGGPLVLESEEPKRERGRVVA